jgi:hypothetical protein
MSTRKLLLLGAWLVLGCDPDPRDDDDGASSDESGGDDGQPDCERGPVVTYDTFGRGFMAAYCNGCHGSTVIDRRGAPPGILLDDRETVSMLSDRIFARVLPPDGSAPTMPPAGGITPDDRERLVVWLSCWP